MTIDERLEFLVESTETLSSTTEGLLAVAGHHDTQIMALVQVAERNERRWTRVMQILRDALDAGLNGDSQEGEDK